MQSLRMPINLMAQSMTNQKNQQVRVPTNRNDLLVEARVCNFVMMGSPMFLGSHDYKGQ